MSFALISSLNLLCRKTFSHLRQSDTRRDLEKIGVLRGMRIGREKYYTHDQFLHLLAQ